MMTKPAVTSSIALLLAAGPGALLPTKALAVGLTITPPSVAANSTGTITLNITGVASGQTVRVETFLDTNGNGSIDAGEMLVQSFQVTDGQALFIGGVRNTNVPGDEDGTADQKIRAVLNFPALAEAARGVAKYVYKVSPVTGGFTPVTAPFSITQPQYNQKVTGTVFSGGSAVPYAFAFLTDPSMNGGPSIAALADAGGNFTLYTAPGSYAVVALKAGFVSDFSALQVVTVAAGATVTQNLTLTAADRTISGQLKDLDSGAGIPGVQTTAQSESGLFTLVFSDANGNFSIPVSSASTQWGVNPSEKSLALLGYMSLDNNYGVDIGGGNVTGVSIELPKATALIYGTLEDDQGTPLAGVNIYSYHGQYEGHGVTDSSGSYVVGVLGTTEGSWEIEADSADLQPLGYLAPRADVSVSTGQAVEHDLVAHTVTAHLVGQATDDGGDPLDNVCLSAWSDQGGRIDGTTDANGNFSLGVVGGTWHFELCSSDARQRELVPPTLTRSVQNGVDVTGIQYVALRATAHITGTVHDAYGTPIENLDVYAYTTINGINYNVSMDTAGNGHYSLPVVNGSWQVGVDCGSLSARALPCPNNQPVTVSGQSQMLDFCVGCGPQLCVGDCDGGNTVTVNEILVMVNIALGSAGTSACPHGIPTGAQVNISLIIQAVLNALGACPAG